MTVKNCHKLTGYSHVKQLLLNYFSGRMRKEEEKRSKEAEIVENFFIEFPLIHKK